MKKRACFEGVFFFQIEINEKGNKCLQNPKGGNFMLKKIGTTTIGLH